MRLHRLRLAAFGPFPGEVDIDLDALGADGLFLLHGDTGAGKTTVLDAVAFALFGRVPGARNEAKRLRCDTADVTTKTVVRLEATLGGHRVEIVRSPAYLRPKARGTGLTEEKHKVLLRWLDSPPDGSAAAGLTRAEEVGLAVTDLLGMSADQFFQVVLLPQGEFARFLRSDTAEREVLLERLFDTGRFGTVEEWFAAARRDSKARLGDRKAQIGQLMARVAEAAGRPGCPEEGATQWLADLRDRLADDAAVGADAAATAGRARVAADQALQEARGLSLRVRRLRQLCDRRGRLELAAEERASWRRALMANVQAQPVMSAAVLAASRAQRTAAQQVVVDRRRSVAEMLVAPQEDVPKTAADLRLASAANRESAGALAGLVSQSIEQDHDAASLSAVRTAQRQTLLLLTELDRTLSELPGVVLTLSTRVDCARAAAEQVGALAERAAAAKAVAVAAESVSARRAAQQRSAERSVSAVDKHQRAVDRRQRLVEQRILGMAAELAAGLGAGHACPVCGSAEHPQPAAPADGAVTIEQVASAEEAEQVAAAARQRSAADCAAAALAVGEALALSMGRDLQQANDDWQHADADLNVASERAADLVPAQSALLAAGARLQDATGERLVLSARRESARAEEDRLAATMTAREIRLDLGRAGYSDVAARRDHLLAQADALDRLAAAREVLDAAELSQAEASTSLADAIAGSPFPHLAAARAAAAIDRDDLSRRLRAAEDELTVVTALLADPELAGLDSVADPDVPGAEAVATLARAAAEGTALAAAAGLGRRDQVAAAAAKLAVAWRELEPVIAADSELAALTDVILGKGQNARSMSLRTYVLAAKLAQVALSAGERLAAMSGGRYTFVQSQEKEARGRSGGLGLDIFDAFSGQVRPTKTLSGGESFLASLALALGLADVVAAEAGGRQLDTMFIDEGFGSLDSDTLDMVMGTLDELRAGGRIVGLVSHVDELRQRIPSRLRIRCTPTGSELEMSTG